jgi:hypothetical protein
MILVFQSKFQIVIVGRAALICPPSRLAIPWRCLVLLAGRGKGFDTDAPFLIFEPRFGMALRGAMPCGILWRLAGLW